MGLCSLSSLSLIVFALHNHRPHLPFGQTKKPLLAVLYRSGRQGLVSLSFDFFLFLRLVRPRGSFACFARFSPGGHIVVLAAFAVLRGLTAAVRIRFFSSSLRRFELLVRLFQRLLDQPDDEFFLAQFFR